MALPVVIVSSGGLPMNRLSAHGGLPVTLAAQGIAVTEAPAGYGLPMTFVTEGGSVVLPGPPPMTTWSATDINNATLSNGNLRATIGSGNGGVRGGVSKTSGKYYWEYTYTTLNSNSFTTGLALASGSLTNPTTGVARLNRLNGNIFVNSLDTTMTLGTIPPAAVVGVAVDLGAQLIWFRVAPAGNWNGSGTANPATGVGGASIGTISGPLFPLMSGASGDAVTANFGASTFSGTVPSGFTSGWPT